MDLGVPAFLGMLTTAAGLGEGDFEGTSAGLFNLAGDGFLTTVPVTTICRPRADDDGPAGHRRADGPSALTALT